MPKEVTDPDLLNKLNAPQEQDGPRGREVTDSAKIKDLNRGPDPIGPVARRVPGFIHGGLQSIAGNMSTAMDLPLKLNEGKLPVPVLGDVGLPPYVGPAVGHVMQATSPFTGVWSMIPEKYREDVRQWAGAESESPEQTAGYIAGEVGQAAATPGALGLAARGGKLALGTTASVGLWEGAKAIADYLGTDHVWPIFLMLRHSPGLFRTGGSRMGGRTGAQEPVAPAPRTIPKETPKPKEPPSKGPTELPGTFPWKPQPPTQ
jgi:hypothetical protein